MTGKTGKPITLWLVARRGRQADRQADRQTDRQEPKEESDKKKYI